MKRSLESFGFAKKKENKYRDILQPAIVEEVSLAEDIKISEELVGSDKPLVVRYVNSKTGRVVKKFGGE